MATTMRTISRPTRLTRLAIAISLLTVAAANSQAGSWKLKPSLDVRETYTSNLNLDENNEVSTFITQIRPGFSLNKQGGRVQTNISYGLQLTEYSASEGNDFSSHQLNANAKAELLEDHLFLDASSTISQQLISNRSASTGNNLNNNDAFSTTTTFSISPYWRQKIGDDLIINARLTYDDVSFDDTNTDSDGFTFSTSIDYQADASPRDFHWSVDLNNSQVSSDSGNDNDSDTIRVSAGYRFTPKLDTTLSYGYVDNHIDAPTDTDASSGDFWGVRADWNPTTRTLVSASYDSRKTTTGQGLVVNHRRRHTTWSLVYNENISSTRQQLLTHIPKGSVVCSSDFTNCSVTTEEVTVIDDGLEIFSPTPPTTSLTDDRFIQKSLTGNVVYAKGKSTYNLGLFSREREFQSGSLNSEEDIGFNLGWSLKLNSRTNANLSYAWSQLSPDAADKDTINSLALRFTRRLDPDTSLSLVVNANKRSSDDATLEYTEHSLGATLVRTF